MPRVMTSGGRLETISDESGRVRAMLSEEADRSMESVCGNLGLAKHSNEDGQRAGGFTALRAIAASAVPLRTSAAVGAGAGAAGAAGPQIILLSEEETGAPRRFFLSGMRPF